MGDKSFTSLLILVVLFIVLPSVLKFIGQYTLGSKNAGKNPDESEPADTGTELMEYGEEQQDRGRFGHHDLTPVSNKPINPRWF